MSYEISVIFVFHEEEAIYKYCSRFNHVNFDYLI